MTIQVAGGVKFSGGSYVGGGSGPSGGGPAGGDITLTFTEFQYPSGSPIVGPNVQDGTASITGTGFITNNPTDSGIAMMGLTASNLTFVAANLPDSIPGVNGEIWTANWASGSTYNSTPVAAYYSSSSWSGGNPALVFWILDPADNTYNTGAAGTFNFPMTLTAGTTTTSFQN
jgi:hypothetical protein